MKKTSPLALALCALGLVASPVSAGPVSVYVGYVDNLRSSGFFPSPWIGDPNVVSQTPGGQSLDAGAVRIDNLSGASITISNFDVYFPNISTHFGSLWSSLTLAAGKIGVFTQTASYNFDTSDFGIFGGTPPAGLFPSGINLIGGCSSPAALVALAGQTAACGAAAPVITFDIGVQSFLFTDTGHILDTGGYDFVNYSADGNESINWNVVGGAATRGGTGVPEPVTLSLFGSGLVGVFVMRRRKKKTT